MCWGSCNSAHFKCVELHDPQYPQHPSFFVHAEDRQNNSLSKDRARLVDLMNQ